MGNRDAKARRDAQWAENQGLVWTIAKDYLGRGLDDEDLEQTAQLALLAACDGFDPCRGVAFSTYACNVMKYEIAKAIAARGTFKVPRTLPPLLNRFRLWTEAGGVGGAEAFADEAGLAPCRRRRFLAAVSRGLPRLDPDGHALIEEAPAPEDGEDAADSEVARLMRYLSPVQARIIRSLYGLGGTPQKNLRELAAELGVSHQRVHQIKEMALRRMRRA